MSAKKICGIGSTYLISTDQTDNPKLLAKVLSNGQSSLFLEYYLGYRMVYAEANDKMVARKNRKRKYLDLFLHPIDTRVAALKEENKETLKLAKKIRFEKEQELKERGLGYRLDKKEGKLNFLEYFQIYIDKYTKKDIRMMQIALHRFEDFLRDTPEYNKFKGFIEPKQLTKDMMIDFTEYLQSRSRGEGAKSIYQRFKKVLNYAVGHDVLIKSPCLGVSIKIDDNVLRKEILSADEEQILIGTHYQGENQNVRRAFIFCLYTGLRFCDVKDLTFANIDFSNKLLKFEQNKTKGHSASSGVVQPLRDEILELIGQPASDDTSELIFKLPSYESCSKSLRRWVARAGIKKHISWHCARHSFATMVLNNGANVNTTAVLLGHSDLQYIKRYVRATDTEKKAALNSLPPIKLK